MNRREMYTGALLDAHKEIEAGRAPWAVVRLRRYTSKRWECVAHFPDPKMCSFSSASMVSFNSYKLPFTQPSTQRQDAGAGEISRPCFTHALSSRENVGESRTCLVSFPTELILCIFWFLDGSALEKASRSCRLFASTLRDSPTLWSHVIAKEFPSAHDSGLLQDLWNLGFQCKDARSAFGKRPRGSSELRNLYGALQQYESFVRAVPKKEYCFALFNTDTLLRPLSLMLPQDAYSCAKGKRLGTVLALCDECCQGGTALEMHDRLVGGRCEASKAAVRCVKSRGFEKLCRADVVNGTLGVLWRVRQHGCTLQGSLVADISHT